MIDILFPDLYYNLTILLAGLFYIQDKMLPVCGNAGIKKPPRREVFYLGTC